MGDPQEQQARRLLEEHDEQEVVNRLVDLGYTRINAKRIVVVVGLVVAGIAAGLIPVM